MDITWLGHSCFRLKGKDVTLITDPFSSNSGASLGPKLTANIVTVSHDAPGHNNTIAIGGSPRLLTGPGEYEISGVLITGIPSYHDAEQGKQRGRNTIFLIQIDEVIVCHLGDLGHPLTAEQQEQITDVDILLVPVGGHSTITATGAVEVINQIEPRLVIPMHYATSLWQHLDSVDKFCQEMGVKEMEPQQNVRVTKTTLPAERQVMLLSSK